MDDNFMPETVEVLEWYDEPLIVKAVSNGTPYLGLLISDNRWMYARLTDEQVTLLGKHELPLRETFEKATDGYVYVSTFLYVPVAQLTEDNLPTKDAGAI